MSAPTVFKRERGRNLIEFICPICHDSDAGMGDNSHLTLAINHLFIHLQERQIAHLQHLENHANGVYKE